MARDYYEILGLQKNSSKDDIRRAYRRLAHDYHPDKQGGGDEKKFREINEAYEVLSDDAKRGQYDKFGQTFEQARASGQSGFGGFSGFQDFSEFMHGVGENFSRGPFSGIEFDFGDIFSDIFGGARQSRRTRGVDLEMILEIDFLEGVFGAEREIELDKKDICQHCKGSGAEPGSKVITCPRCHGLGQITSKKQTILGNVQHVEVCSRCQGQGKLPEKECAECHGQGVRKQKKAIKVTIPAGIENGQRIKVSGEGEAGYRGSQPGDLYIAVRIKPSSKFERSGSDILSTASISFYQAALGAKIAIDSVDGEVMLKVPPGTQGGDVLRLRGKGVPHIQTQKRGDHLVTVKVLTPKKLSKEEREIFRKLAEKKGENIDPDDGMWGKIKDNF
ncbi:MAG: molecular chaperone DnaJ [Candidatus Doudnabacteria bacterium]|nr:molecular chaperone DnaJ [bacterium]MDZ4244020.1 molecular chaperone DnaJ [Candidatus Doudnabacteria bacterium]